MKNEMEVEHLDVVADHVEKFEAAKKQFVLIFPLKNRAEMVLRLNNLRMDASVWQASPPDSFKSGRFVANPEVAPLFDRVVELSAQVCRYVHIGKLVYEDDNEEVAQRQKHFHDLQMILYRHARAYRKKERPIPLCMFTPGTVFESYVEHVDKEVQVNTVGTLKAIELGYGLITVAEPCMQAGHSMHHKFEFPTTDYRTLNTSHVTRIVKHAPGAAVIRRDDHIDSKDSYLKYEQFDKLGKSRRTYACLKGNFLARNEVDRLGILKDPDQQVDNSQLISVAFSRSPGVRSISLDDGWHDQVFLIRKKKWKRWIRQNMNRFLMSRKRQEQQEHDYQEQMDREFTSDFSFLDSRLEDEDQDTEGVKVHSSADELTESYLGGDAFNDSTLGGDWD